MIDIIIPAYNAHKYIKDTLVSIAMQTIKNKINVYIIDDCSNNNYNEIVNLFKNKINIIELKLNKNSGPGIARQYGMDNSHGEYIFFIDSDDLLYNKFSLEKLYNAIKSEDFDYAVGGMLDEQGENLFYYSNHMGCLHGKLFKRKYLEEKNIRFNDTRGSEDHSFNKLVIMSEPKTIYVDEEIYVYRDNPSSVTARTLDIDLLRLYIENAIWVEEESKKRNYNKYLVAEHIFMCLCYIYSIYISNIDCSELDDLLKYNKDLVLLNEEYEKILLNEDKLNIYESYNITVIPLISLNDFCKKCKEK